MFARQKSQYSDKLESESLFYRDLQENLSNMRWEETMLKFNNVTRLFQGPEGAIRAVQKASFTVVPRELVAVQGPSGSGKTTLLLMAGGLLRPSEGTILVDGQDPYSLAAKQRSTLRAEKIGFVFQQFHLIPYLTVQDNILAPSGACPRLDARTRVMDLMCHFKLEHRINHVPAQLSTGERQRTALARALLNRPGILLADEPTGNLDDRSAEIVLNHLHEFAADGGAVLLVSHDMRVAKYASRTLLMEEGRMVEQ
jgi:putative ABC transport system ATP-binding protein